MTNTEQLLEMVLNLFIEQHERMSFWIMDEDEHDKGYLIYDDEESIDIFIVTVKAGKLVPA